MNSNNENNNSVSLPKIASKGNLDRKNEEDKSIRYRS